MGVDTATYRMRIGCNRTSIGTDVVEIIVDLDFSKATQGVSLLAAITLLLAGCISCSNPSHEENQSMTFCSFPAIVLLSSTIYHHSCISFKQWKERHLSFRNIGAVTFIGLLLLLAGIEPNPGPGPHKGQRSKVGNLKVLFTFSLMF